MTNQNIKDQHGMAEQNSEKHCGMANPAVLSVEHADTVFKSVNKVARTSEKFVRMAALLPVPGFLGWQITADKQKGYSSIVYASPGAKVTVEDYNWIFQKCAVAGEAADDFLEDLFEGGRKVYAFTESGNAPMSSFTQNKSNSPFSSDDSSDTPCNHYFYQMFDMLAEEGAIIRFTAGSCDGGEGEGAGSESITGSRGRTCGESGSGDRSGTGSGSGADRRRGIGGGGGAGSESGSGSSCGMIQISMKRDISLRMSSLVSLAFPNIVIREMDRMKENDLQKYSLKDSDLCSCMNSFLYALMDMNYDREDAAADTDEDSIARTPIDVLGLDYGCYRRMEMSNVYSIEILRTLSDEDYMDVFGSKRRVDRVRRKLAEYEKKAGEEKVERFDYMDQLNRLVGLEDVKRQIHEIAAYARMKKAMPCSAREKLSFSLNMEFVGNPGTAKTTVARIVAGIFCEIGILPESEIFEVGRSDLVGTYAGQTAELVRSVFRMAKGKVLFIDEAYSLSEYWSGGYGDEAINAIVQEMENRREKTIVIFAGYPDKMEEFFSRNPGLRSRVPFRISFPDYTAADMVSISEYAAREKGFTIAEEAKEKVMSLCERAKEYGEEGNGRFCRNLVESAIIGYATRKYGSSRDAGAADCILRSDDFSLAPILRRAEEVHPIGF